MESAGRRSGMIMRSRKLTACSFLDILFSTVSQELVSLQSLCGELLFCSGIELSKVGLHKRFGPSSVQYVKGILLDLLNLRIESGGLQSKKMKRLCIKDSTRFGLDTRHWKMYTGTHGPRSSSMGIQCEFDLLSGQVLDIDVHSGVQNDAKDARSKTDRIEQGDLCVRDLGYICQDVLNQIIDNGALFLNRLNSIIDVYLDQQGNEILNFAGYYWKMKKEKTPTLELDVYLGKTKTPCRLILDIVPEKVYRKRMSQINTTNRHRGCTTSKRFKQRSRFNLFITNIPRKELPMSGVIQTYHIRWQVELVFKTWKSLFKIDSNSAMNTCRWQTMTYARLLWIVILWDIFIYTRNSVLKQDEQQLELLSLFKCMKQVTLNIARIRQWIRLGVDEFLSGFKLLDRVWSKYGTVEHRKGKARIKTALIIQDIL